jgi:hypothetical protein
MGRRGFATRLPRELREELDRQIVDGRLTITELKDWLADRGVDASRSAVGRHVQSVEEIATEMRKAREVAGALKVELGDQADGTIGQALIEVAQNVVFRAALPLMQGHELGLEDLHFLARAAKDLASAQKTDADRARKLREEALQAGAKAAEGVAKARGLTAETVAEIKRAVLGVA